MEAQFSLKKKSSKAMVFSATFNREQPLCCWESPGERGRTQLGEVALTES